ncbi:unnamed protein product [Phaedon cochleariae]|uniref:AAA+ ATPase domain-containing protein n=1 Tax=Phaedon cochleariae TaxID=80249 RepID=A0A9P0DKL9_PHACE|nr:unnamed protein product [Phaedon cochleariae]
MSMLNQNKESKGPRRAKSFNKDATDFSKVGGLGNHLKTLREIIIFPLLHGNVFSHFKIKPPRGVLFHGPPGTGKTLVAGALASEINKEGVGKVSFFQRKGADILDIWVGGSEKNLRTLFEKATKNRPSIIFFDELDGLAPIRSGKNDHIHTSVVATLLSLMDGLDSKPGVIVIGATNRIEAIDPALRRPGRFDKELYFPLPSVEARKEIMQVHINSWKHKPSEKFIASLADSTVGFCGSDLQALCSDAVLCCLRRVYPQVETKGCNTKIEANKLEVQECDFMEARLNILPSSLKQGQKMRHMSSIIKPLLIRQENKILEYSQLLWPHFFQEEYRYTISEKRYSGRILLVGSNMQGLNNHLIPSILKNLEHIPAFIYDTRIIDKVKPNLTNVHMNIPSVIVLSRIDEWWDYIDDCDQHSIVSTLEDIHAGLPILTIASCRVDIPTRLHNFFYYNNTLMIKIENPNDKERENFLAPLFFDETCLSLLSIYQETSQNGNHFIKCESSEYQTGRKRKKRGKKVDYLGIGDNPDSIGIPDPHHGKRKLEESNYDLVKKIKLCESKFGDYRSCSSTSLFDPHRKIKQEKGYNGEIMRSTSLESFKKKQYFTRVLSDLLNQRSITLCRKSCTSSNSLDSLLCDKLIKIEPKDDYSVSSVDLIHSQSVFDVHWKRIYTLWKHASLLASRNMSVAQLELLYDVISTCLSINRNSFEAVLLNLETVLRNIEISYQVDGNNVQCP